MCRCIKEKATEYKTNIFDACENYTSITCSKCVIKAKNIIKKE